MIKKTNYHTHSTFCDGKSALEDIVKVAIEQKMKILGFSSHAMYPFATNWHMQIADYAEYFREIHSLQKKYTGKLEILAGLEVDFIPPLLCCNKELYHEYAPDYIIGSIHYISNPDHGCVNLPDPHMPSFFSIDGSIKELRKGIQIFFNGNNKKAIQTYFALQRSMVTSCNFDIIGHADVIRKRNVCGEFFNEEDIWYKNELKETAKAFAKSTKIVEINTGGMSRAGVKTPYPSPYFLELLVKEGARLMLNSDSHVKDSLLDNFDVGIAVAKQAGARELWYLSENKWQSYLL